MKSFQYDLVVMGSTGFTGRLVVEYLLDHYGVKNKQFSWAIAARDKRKLGELKLDLEHRFSDMLDLPVIIVDSYNKNSIDQMTLKARVVISTVGPYLKYGHQLVQSCAENGTHYCDLTGEVPFIRESIERYDKLAKKNKCKIIHSCGFDSLPSDIGVLLLQEKALRTFGKPFSEIKLYVKGMAGGISGGTIDSAFTIYEYTKNQKNLRKILSDPYSLVPSDKIPSELPRKGLSGVHWDAEMKRWVCPFAMAGINTKIVRMTNGLLNNQYGKYFKYSEVYSFKEGVVGYIKALSMITTLAAFKVSLYSKLIGKIARTMILPKPGQGPSKQKRDNGYFKLELVGLNERTRIESLIVEGNSDAGYSGTAKMITESALSLILNTNEIPNTFGVLSTASGIGRIVAKRLEMKGIKFNMR